jgi:hypothetical protein
VVKLDGTVIHGSDYLNMDIGSASLFARQAEHVFNWVWWHRLAYFFTAIATLALLALPFVLSESASDWKNAFASHPALFIGLVILVGYGLRVGSGLECRTKDAMRQIWYGVAKMKSHCAKSAVPAPSGRINQAVEWLRTRPAYAAASRILVRTLIPSLILVTVLYGGAVLVFEGMAQPMKVDVARQGGAK